MAHNLGTNRKLIIEGTTYFDFKVLKKSCSLTQGIGYLEDLRTLRFRKFLVCKKGIIFCHFLSHSGGKHRKRDLFVFENTLDSQTFRHIKGCITILTGKCSITVLKNFKGGTVENFTKFGFPH